MASKEKCEHAAYSTKLTAFNHMQKNSQIKVMFNQSSPISTWSEVDKHFFMQKNTKREISKSWVNHTEL